jgi:peptidoglycan/LPS O-acetylase OafA/YrhL
MSLHQYVARPRSFGAELGALSRLEGDSFDLMRLVAALLVLWSHQSALIGLPEPIVPLLRCSLGTCAVYVFFSVSGYLNTKSMLRRRDLWRFLTARALRIYPALAVCTALTVIYCAVATSAPFDEFFLAAARYLTNAIWPTLYQHLPGIFETSSVPHLINASLWTIPREIGLYVLLAALCIRNARCAIVIATAVCITSELARSAGYSLPNSLQFGLPFFVGACCAAMPQSAIVLAGAAATCVAIGNVPIGCEILLGLSALAVGHLPLPRFLGMRHDMSYGVYLYAFPCQQIAVTVTHQFWPSLAIASALTLSLAWLSCLFVEEPALRFKSRVYRLGIN